MLTTLAVDNYRSLRNFIVPLSALNLITGANGSGKSSVYRALRLLAETATGNVVAAIAREGGLPSTLWAGPETSGDALRRGGHPVQGTARSAPVSLRLGFASDTYGYAIDLGVPPPSITAFGLDPHIKRECVWAGPTLRPANLLVDRNGPAVKVRDDEQGWQVLPLRLSPFDGVMPHCADPRAAPEILALREHIRSWRFYDHFRTDAAAPARQPQVGTHTRVLAHDGGDVAAALQTILETGDAAALASAVDDAFPGARLDVAVRDGVFELQMVQPGLLRPLRSAELSDGTLRYILWIAALLSPVPPGLLVLNEPETSLHPELLPALGRLIKQAAQSTQVIVVSHADPLIQTLTKNRSSQLLELEKNVGETHVLGLGDLQRPPWRWAER